MKKRLTRLLSAIDPGWVAIAAGTAGAISCLASFWTLQSGWIVGSGAASSGGPAFIGLVLSATVGVAGKIAAGPEFFYRGLAGPLVILSAFCCGLLGSLVTAILMFIALLAGIAIVRRDRNLRRALSR